MASPFDHPELIPPRPAVGVHTGPPPPDDRTGCRACGESSKHTLDCELAEYEGRAGDYVRTCDVLPGNHPDVVARNAGIDARRRQPTRIKRVRDAILERAASLISGEREQQYGSAIDNFTAIGKLWAVTFGLEKPISPVLVAIAMSQLKQVRLMNDPNHADSWPDAAGYIGLGGDIAAELEADRRAYEKR